jgi:hypothetical protein
MQKEILALIDLGPLPASAAATPDQLKRHEAALHMVKKPVSDDEACALARLFGPDDCFGLAWTLLHLIESAPSWPIADCLAGLNGEWAQTLRERARRKL